MKLNEILMAILNNTNSMKEKGIKDIYSEMQECLI